MGPILALADLSETTAGVLRTSADLARSTGREVIILHVAGADAAAVDEAGGGDFKDAAPAAANGEAGRDVRAARRRLEIVELELNRLGVRADTLLLAADERGARHQPIALILEQIERLRPSFVVMGYRGHGWLHQLLVGRVRDNVLRRARCPVVVVPTMAAAAEADDGAGGERPEPPR
jgi:nucleotide-binding universal stress UspA family protein